MLSLGGAGRHQCPAGTVDPGEGLREAACRELLEETGWNVKPDDLLFVETYNYVTVYSFVRQNAALPPGGKDTAQEFLKDSSGCFFRWAHPEDLEVDSLRTYCTQAARVARGEPACPGTASGAAVGSALGNQSFEPRASIGLGAAAEEAVPG